MAGFASGQAVQVFSNSSQAWVDAVVLDVQADATVRVQYGTSQKVIRHEFHGTLLRQKPTWSPRTEYGQGQVVEVFSKSSNQWVAANVREVLPDGSLHVQYCDALHLFKVIPAHLQACAVRPAASSGVAAPATVADASRAVATPQAGRSPPAAAPPAAAAAALAASPLAAAPPAAAPPAAPLAASAPAAAPSEAAPRPAAATAAAQPAAAAAAARPPAATAAAPAATPLPAPLAAASSSSAPAAHAQAAPGSLAAAARQSAPVAAAASSMGRIVQVPPEDDWRCALCTFTNPPYSASCQMCLAPRGDGERLGGRAVVDAQRQPPGEADAQEEEGEEEEEEEEGEPEDVEGGEEASQQLLAQATTFLPKLQHGAGGGQRNSERCSRGRPARSRSRSPRGASATEPTQRYEELVEVTGTSSSASASSGPPLRLPRSLHDGLWTYQKDGVSWMWSLYQSRHGGVLADEMGLGKTVQACAFIQAVRAVGGMHAVVLVPVTLMKQWAKEIRRWCPDVPVYMYHGTPSQRGRALDAIKLQRGGVLLTSYNIVKSENQHLLGIPAAGDDAAIASSATATPVHVDKRRRLTTSSAGASAAARRPWDVMICDEAHVMRGITTLLGKALRNVRSNCRVLLTGTPVQNRLQDMWALMDFAQPGLLGNHSTFVKRFSDPIEKGSVRSSGPSAVALKKHLCEQLLQLVAPHLLRRTKESIGLQTSDLSSATTSLVRANSRGEVFAPKALLPKVELVVWLSPTKEQISTYKEALATSEVIREANDKTRLGLEVFKAIGLLKRLCNHPALGLPVSKPGVWQEFLSGPATGLPGCFRGNILQPRSGPSLEGKRSRAAAAGSAASAADEAEDGAGAAEAGTSVEKLLHRLPRDPDSVIAQSAKLRCLAVMLPALIERGHRVLVFSQGVMMMDLVEVCVLLKQNIGYLRLDGQTDIKTRAERVASFQSDPHKYKCMLLTTRVGGYGLNLTGADRVIMLDPAWNPATDAQAVDRAYRIGQEKEVRTYRLVMSGLIEDKMFRLQVFKMGLTNAALEAAQQNRYFTTEEIRALFKWADPKKGETMRLIAERHGEEDGVKARQNADVDGAGDGWLQAGPAVGLSDFSTLHRTLGAEEPASEEEAATEEVRAMKAKLSVAEQKSARLSEARSAAERQVDQAQLDAKETAQQIASAAENRAKAGQRQKAAQGDLVKARREEASAEKAIEKAAQEQLATQKHMFAMDERQMSAKVAGDSAAQQSVQANEALTATERVLSQAVDDASAGVEHVHAGTRPAGLELERGGAVSAPAGPTGATRKALERMQKQLDATRAARAAAATALEELVDAEARVADAEAEAAILERFGSLEAQAATTPKAALAAAKAAAKEAARAEKTFEKAAEGAAGVQEQAGQAIQEFREATATLAEALRAEGDARAMDVKSVQQELKANARSIAAAWQAVRAAQQACVRSDAQRRKAARAAAASSAECKEARARGLAADRGHRRAAEETAAAKSRRIAREREVEQAQADGAEADMRGAGQKRRREELKAELAEAKQGLRAAKAAEKEANAGRNALYSHYAKAGECTKEEAAAAGAAARASAEEQQQALEAIRALKDEAYDANQVVEAYEHKRRTRLEAEAAAAAAAL